MPHTKHEGHKHPAEGDMQGSADQINPKEPSQAELNKDMKENPNAPGTDNSSSEGQTSGG